MLPASAWLRLCNVVEYDVTHGACSLQNRPAANAWKLQLHWLSTLLGMHSFYELRVISHSHAAPGVHHSTPQSPYSSNPTLPAVRQAFTSTMCPCRYVAVQQSSQYTELNI